MDDTGRMGEQAQFDRPVLRPVARDLRLAAGRCALAVAVGVAFTGVAIADHETPGTWIIGAAIAFVLAVRFGSVAEVMARGQARPVRVDDRCTAAATAGGLWTRNTAAGHWVHLTDSRTELALGWIEVRPGGAREIADVDRCGLIGDPSRHSRAVLTGPFGTIVPRGRSYRERPTPWFRIAGRARPSRWQLPRGPRPPGV